MVATGPVWVAMVLKPLAEKLATFPELERDIRKYIKSEISIFFPVASGDYEKKLSEARILIDGYVFLHVVIAEVTQYDFSDSMYFEGLLCEEGVPCIIPDSDITKMREQVEVLFSRGLGKGSKVKVVDGVYQNLKGEIKDVDMEKKMAIVSISLSSKSFEASISLAFLEEES